MIRAWWLGVRDGWRAPTCLSTGVTWPDPALNEAYDYGVNVGQFARMPRRCEWRNQ